MLLILDLTYAWNSFLQTFALLSSCFCFWKWNTFGLPFYTDLTSLLFDNRFSGNSGDSTESEPPSERSPETIRRQYQELWQLRTDLEAEEQQGVPTDQEKPDPISDIVEMSEQLGHYHQGNLITSKILLLVVFAIKEKRQLLGKRREKDSLRHHFRPMRSLYQLLLHYHPVTALLNCLALFLSLLCWNRKEFDCFQDRICH